MTYEPRAVSRPIPLYGIVDVVYIGRKYRDGARIEGGGITVVVTECGTRLSGSGPLNLQYVQKSCMITDFNVRHGRDNHIKLEQP